MNHRRLPAAHFAAPPTGRFFFGLCTVQLLWFSCAFTQRSAGLFGPILEHPLASEPAALVAERGTPAEREFSVLTLSPPRITLVSVAAEGKIREGESFRIASNFRTWWNVDLDRDGADELVGLSAGADTLALLSRRPALRGWAEVRLPLGVRPSRVVAADIDNDGRTDLLLCGRSMAGVQVYRGLPGGKFVPGDLLFPDVSAADIAVADLNGDGIADVFLANWLSNQVAVSFGISRGIFSEQLTIELESEPSALALGPVSRRRTAALAILLPEVQKLVVYGGNGAGEFRLSASLRLPGTITDARFVSLNSDVWPDLVATGGRQLYTITARSGTAFDQPVPHGAGAATGMWLLSDVDNDRRTDLVFCDRQLQRFVVAGRPLPGARFPWRAEYLAGSRPWGVTVLDANLDGRPDIVVANSGSASISLFSNRGGGSFSAQDVFETPERPTVLSSVEGAPGIVVSSHRNGDFLSVTDVGGIHPQGGFTIPTASDPLLLHGFRSGRDSTLRFLVRARGSAQQSVSFSVFEQLSGKLFLEKNFQASLPTALRAITTGNITGNGPLDLCVATHVKNRGRSVLSYAAAGDDFGYRNVVPLVEIPDTIDVIRGLLMRDVDNDGIEDVLILPGALRHAVGIAYGRSRGVMEPELSWVTGLSPANSRNIVIDDLDGDGYRDIAVLDQNLHSIRVAFGTGRRGFLPPVEAAEAGGSRAFAIAPLVNPRVQDLVLTSEERGVISIKYGAFAR